MDFIRRSQSASLPRELLNFYEAKLRAQYHSGEHIPIIFPYHLLGILVVIVYLLLPPSLSKLVRYGRFPVFAFFFCWCVEGIRKIRSAVPHVCYGIGIIGAWSVFWIAALILWRDARVESCRIWPTDESPSKHHLAKNSVTHSSRDRHQDGFYWQPLPSQLLERLHWIADLGISLRGPGWTHASRGLPPPPKHVLSRLQGHLPPGANSYIANVRVFSDKDSLIRHTLFTLVASYLALDLLKTMTMQDPYFLGYISAPSPYFDSWIVARVYRSVITMAYIGISLNTIFELNPWFFAYVCGPHRFFRLGIKAEPWLYPGMFGSFSHVWKQGLGGFWSMWWHQVFRVGFAAPVEWFTKLTGWDVAGKDKVKAKALGAVMAFGSSGLIHAIGSWTSLGETDPLRPFLFFALQGIAVMVEAQIRQAAVRRAWFEGVPQRVKEAGTLLYTVCWLLVTSPLLCDDFARSRVWLFEPVAVSPFRGLRGEGWIHWDWRVLQWYTDKEGKWWRSGIALI